MPINKPLIIKVQDRSVPNGEAGRWTDFTAQMPTFTRDIVTPPLLEGGDAGAIVSGIPTVFSRANLFKSALDYVQNNRQAEDTANGNLIAYYDQLRTEWRGFIACLALDYPRIGVKRIVLEYSDQKNSTETANIYEPKGAFGNMLFERRDLWCEQQRADNNKKVPFMDVVKYEGKVVGGTSPESLLFTSVAYRLEKNAPFVNKKTGKFIDPLKSDLNANEVAALYGYVENLLRKINAFNHYYNELNENLKPNYGNIVSNLEAWRNEIRNYAEGRHFNLDVASVPPVDRFLFPFSLLFNYSDELYGLEGVVTSDYQHGAIQFDPKKLLLPKSAEIARIHFSNEIVRNPQLLTQQPVYVMTARKKGDDTSFAYFALPLSALGLNVFGKNIGALVGIPNNGVDIHSKLTAVFDPDAIRDNLEVKLHIVATNGETKEMKETYTVKESCVKNKDIVLWPDFISKQWNRYFIYSEIPHNSSLADCPFRAVPFVGREDDDHFRILTEENGEPLCLAKDGKIVAVGDKVKSKLLVVADNRVADNPYKYEIYESNKPFKGLKLTTVTNRDAGYLIINYSSRMNKLNVTENLTPANLGIDFGSTNTSVAYFMDTETNARGLHLKSHRVSLLRAEPDTDDSVVTENKVFFFQHNPVDSNSIKSMLTLHDSKRLTVSADENGEVGMLEKELKGGMPCFCNNLPIDTVNENSIRLLFKGCGEVTLVHNMKWSNQAIDKAHKTAYLRSLMLHIYAEMFQNNIVPVRLKWSYPSAMGDNLVYQYSRIWDAIETVNPLVAQADQPVELNISSSKFSQNTLEATKNVFGEGTGGFGTDHLFGSFGAEDGHDASGNLFGSAKNAPSSGPFGDVFNASSEKGFGAFDAAADNDGPAGFASQDMWGGGPDVLNPHIPDLQPGDSPVRFDFQRLSSDGCLTEACAVANYLSNQPNLDMSQQTLTLCFDIGGSTTDISALCLMCDAKGQPGKAMVKQNSIRFAAQRVANATRYSSNFRTVLLDICAKYGIRIQGLNWGDSKYAQDTAPYYFEQLVDRMNAAQLAEFYSRIGADCPELMSVNLYVTGLIMYYAGQLANKLIIEINKSPNRFMVERPIVNIVFAGKGSRIFEWFSHINYSSAYQYYGMMFINGFGGKQKIVNMLSGWPRIHIPKENEEKKDVKYEVSKGLALRTDELLVPLENKAIEILGEENFEILDMNGKVIKLEYNQSITAEMMEHIGSYFKQTIQMGQAPCPKFMEFTSLFYQAASKFFGFNMPKVAYIEGFRNMNINSYISNLPEYRKAKAASRTDKTRKFDFVAPIIILEGMKFYDDYLLKNLSQGLRS